MNSAKGQKIVGTFIHAISWDETLSILHGWAVAKESRYICICNVHSVISAKFDAQFAKVLGGADMATPDGAPVAWMLRRLGHLTQERINGPDLMLRYCRQASETDQSIFLYGGHPDTLAQLEMRLKRDFPGLRIAGSISPPFRTMTDEEELAVVEKINSSGANTVWVSLGCPKQEHWMARNRGRVNSVMIGVGAAFDYHAGTLKRAPMWMQTRGLEWAYRLFSEPRRLWRRYLFTNSLFILLGAWHLICAPLRTLTPGRSKQL